MTNKDIAAILVISPKTVANHIEHIYPKIGASNRAMASLFAMKHGLLPEEEPVRFGATLDRRRTQLPRAAHMCASTVAMTSLGLKITNSAPSLAPAV